MPPWAMGLMVVVISGPILLVTFSGMRPSDFVGMCRGKKEWPTFRRIEELKAEVHRHSAARELMVDEANRLRAALRELERAS